MKLKNKICLVTGGSRGIGKSIVEDLIKNGGRVVFTYLNDVESAKRIEDSFKTGEISALQMDVSDRESVRNTFNEICKIYSKIDVLVNNAGINKPEDFDKINDEDWDEVVNVNLKGPFIVTQEFFPLLKKSKSASIINISSVSGQYGGPRTAHYAASKAGLISLSQVIARFGSEYNIRSNSLSAGLISSDMAEEGLQSPVVKEASKNILLKRFGYQKEVANVVSFLASEESAYITGQVINVNGGIYF
jgi:3-oxoacyl-[acyl-carrier protein] reductase